MSKKLALLALIPFFLQASLYTKYKFENIDQRLAKKYANACQAIHSNTKPLFDLVLQALVHEGKKDENNRAITLGHIVAMQKTLQAYRAEEIQKLSYYSWAVGSKPKIITQEIDPALKAITIALKDLKVSTSEYSVAAIAAASILATAAGIGLWLIGAEGRTNELQVKYTFASSKVPKILVNEVSYRQAKDIAKIFQHENKNSINPDLLKEAEKLELHTNEDDIHRFYYKDQDHARALLCALNWDDNMSNIIDRCNIRNIIRIVQQAGLGLEYLNNHTTEL